MRSVKVMELTVESFKKYGSFANMINPVAPRLGAEPVEFFRDMCQLELGGSTTASFSTCRVLKRAAEITELEYHDYTGEGTLPLDADILLTVVPATPKDVLPVDQVEVFRVPRGTFVSFRPGVWHCAPIVSGAACANVLIVLPERIYANDCTVVKLPEKITVE